MTRLRQKGFEPEAIQAALDRLDEVGLLSDERFAERYAEESAGRGLAPRRIQGELRRRGVEPGLAAAASTASEEMEWERARAFARARAARMTMSGPEAIARRVAGQLARRGYPGEICRTIAAEVSGLEPQDP